jgi:hypothetical protein
MMRENAAVSRLRVLKLLASATRQPDPLTGMFQYRLFFLIMRYHSLPAISLVIVCKLTCKLSRWDFHGCICFRLT